MKIRIACVCLLAITAGAQANITVFSDDFNSEHGGVGVLNYTGFANWTVSDGTVDLIGNGFWDLQPGNGLYVDLDGSTSNAGKMLKTTAMNLSAGTYNLRFDLAGNWRSGSDSATVQVAMGALLDTTITLASNVPFTTYSFLFPVVSPGSVSLSFEGVGGDNIGLLLDNIKVEMVQPDGNVVPAPGAIALGMLGLGFVGWVKRRMA